ncbi:PREDICTED: uncharacterized protein LOC108363301 [Rhagoletis zephyria]|uniref:uncharacterized protein LOC108363301 n=1 Tax=Rhagoletis zephyria TaxID=28612 RepID=UPI0008115D4F|nr:PREDICTED: uncharacterized protein LOC108363301 [Rhagoletis zephyria]
MLTLLNSNPKTIKFTIEIEKDLNLPYLDTLVIRKNNRLKIDWYAKPTSSGRLINYNSKHERKTILNTATNFIRRVLTISDKHFHKKNKNIIQQILEQNEFPSCLIRKLIQNYYVRTDKENTYNENKVYKTATYVPGISERIKHSNIYDKEKVQLAFTCSNTLGKIYSNTKDKIPRCEKSDVIYKISCNGDGSHLCHKVYVGTTKTKLKTRISAHKSNIKLRNSSTDNKTALSAHCRDTGHYPDFDNVAILQEEKNYNKRYILEMLHITNTPNERRINFKTDTDNCAHVYRNLVLNRQQQSST